jgi:hypothetical protein
LFLIIDRRNEKGLKHWADELEKRKMPAVILVDDYTLDTYPSLAKEMTEKGFDIGFSYNEQPFWDMEYDAQHEVIKRAISKVKSCTNTSLRIFGSKYFAYDENTLKIADELRISYILARGTAGAKSVVYKPEEYSAKIISVSNVPSQNLGTGSLCDESLRCRGSVPEDLEALLFNLKEDRVILVAQTHVSGVKLNWWNVYQKFLNGNRVDWQSMDTFVKDPIVSPNAEIPLNTRADYRTPQPRLPLEDEPDFPFE